MLHHLTPLFRTQPRQKPHKAPAAATAIILDICSLATVMPQAIHFSNRPPKALNHNYVCVTRSFPCMNMG
ncbi:predicted protein [Botrytis cinerea T4]|uniref:Uncharacterized protein n=1 Tax=Botryotinia fuckeliana (strain T4) TaxID=999810 RepID=G2YZH6_BOTF4|nr:predicted protein [Botrytis cinerea T4]